MKVNEMIEEWNIALVENGIMTFGEMTPKEAAMIKAAKPEIVAELKRRKEEEKTRKEAERQARKTRKEAILTGEEKIKLHYHDGEYLTGWEVHGEAAEVLEELGLARYVEGWGHHVNHDAVQALGEEFTYAEAEEFVRPIVEREKAAQVARRAAREARFVEARKTGKPVELERTTDECDGSVCECSLDLIVRYAMPDGTTKIERIHTY